MPEKVLRAIPAALLTALLAFIFFASVPPERALGPLLAYSVVVTAVLIWLVMGQIN